MIVSTTLPSPHRSHGLGIEQLGCLPMPAMAYCRTAIGCSATLFLRRRGFKKRVLEKLLQNFPAPVVFLRKRALESA